MSKKAFTLIELLVVIAIIALLLSIIIPSLSMAKKKAAAVVCMTNVKNLSLGWFLYQADNDGLIMSARMENVGTQVSAKEGWIGVPFKATDLTDSSLTLAQVTPAVTDEDEIRGIEQGVLYPYMKTADVYHCPADKLRIGPDGTRLYNSYAVPECLYGTTNKSSSLYNLQIKKFSEITSPGSRYNFVESGEKERGNWTIVGHFIIAAPEYGDPYGWWSPVAINHGDSSVFGFCDGHAEKRKWHDQDTFDHYGATVSSDSYGKRWPNPVGEDLSYIIQGWAYRHHP